MSKPYSNSNWHWFLWLMGQSFKFAIVAFQMLFRGGRKEDWINFGVPQSELGLEVEEEK